MSCPSSLFPSVYYFLIFLPLVCRKSSPIVITFLIFPPIQSSFSPHSLHNPENPTLLSWSTSFGPCISLLTCFDNLSCFWTTASVATVSYQNFQTLVSINVAYHKIFWVWTKFNTRGTQWFGLVAFLYHIGSVLWRCFNREENQSNRIISTSPLGWAGHGKRLKI